MARQGPRIPRFPEFTANSSGRRNGFERPDDGAPPHRRPRSTTPLPHPTLTAGRHGALYAAPIDLT